LNFDPMIVKGKSNHLPHCSAVAESSLPVTPANNATDILTNV